MNKILATGFLVFNLCTPAGLLWCEDAAPPTASGAANTLDWTGWSNK